MIGVDSRDASVFLAYVILKSERRPDGWVDYLGIYATRGAARAAVNRSVKSHGKGSATVAGTRILRGTVGWEEAV